MARLEAWAAWLFSCLGIVMVGVSILVVPADAFADAGSACADKCDTECGSDTACYNACIEKCCVETYCWEGPFGDIICSSLELEECMAQKKDVCNGPPVNDCSNNGKGCFYHATNMECTGDCYKDLIPCRACVCQPAGATTCKCDYP
jgi:hypothetical protein